MNILHVYKDYYPVVGGMENHIRVLAEAQVRRGHSVTVLVANPERQTVEENLNSVRVIKAGRIATVASTPLSAELPRILRTLQPDITHLHLPYPVGEVAQWLAGRGRPYVVTYHADATRAVQKAIMLLYGPLFRRVLRGAAQVLVTSPNYAASSLYLHGLADRIRIVPLGVDPEQFSPAPQPTSRPITLLFVGQMRHYKGIDDLLRAMTLLPDKTYLRLAGDGPKRAEWEALSRSLGLNQQVTFLGRVPAEALPDLYRSADIFALPANSRAEAFGAVLLEAMASGLPCVTTKVNSGTSYVVENEVTGVVVPPRSPEALAGALNRLTADPGLRASMGAAGRARVLENFTVDKMIQGVEETYHLALARPSRRQDKL